MKQLILNLKTGDTELADLPAPAPGPRELLIQTTRSLVSPGTERMLVSFGKAGWFEKARQQPERLEELLRKLKTDGLLSTLNAVRTKLDQPLPLGYCNVGKVIAVGKEVTGFKAGDRVVSNGHHAELVTVGQNLAAKIPDNVSDDEAAFAVVGAVALQSIRLLNPTFGERILVIGAGLVGQLTAQLLQANGCTVIATDVDAQKLTLLAERNIQTVNVSVNDLSSITEMDGVIITAAADDKSIIGQAANCCRKRGRIVLSGVVPLGIDRADFYKKELSFQVSCSYGPGRYEADYEQKGVDYPLAYVRWTVQRNFEAVLEAMQRKQLDVSTLITEKIPFEDYRRVYDHMDRPVIASLFEYKANADQKRTIQRSTATFETGKSIGIIGAGNFTGSIVLPLLKKLEAGVSIIAGKNGLNAGTLAQKFSIPKVTTDHNEVLQDPSAGLVMITTRHHLHAGLTIEALQAGKNVFVEKPLALSNEELDRVVDAQRISGKVVQVGFNRRFSPLAQKMRELTEGAGAMNIVATMNVGAIPADHWVHDPEVGGGRIIGEACHLVDLCSFLTGSSIISVTANALEGSTDNASVLLRFANGSSAVINYFANGHKDYSKERVEVYQSGKTLVMDNWRKLTGYGFKNFSSQSITQDKGHKAQFQLLLKQLKKGGPALIPFEEIINTSRATLAIVESIRTNGPVDIK